MNRSILVIICDFLLISLLSFIRIEELPTQVESKKSEVQYEIDLYAVSNLVDVIRIELERERQARTTAEVARLEAERALVQKEALLKEKDKLLSEQQTQLEQIELKMKLLQDEQQRLAQLIKEREDQLHQREQQLKSLESEHQRAQRQIEQLQQDLVLASQEASFTRSQIEAIEQELAIRRAEAERLQEAIKKLIEERSMAESEKQKYAVELARVQTAAELMTKQLEESRQRIKEISQERALLQAHAQQLASGVSQLAQETAILREQIQKSIQELAQSSDNIREKIEEVQEWPANRVFALYLTNAIITGFRAQRSDILGQVVREFVARTVAINIGTNLFAPLHIKFTPWGLYPQVYEWELITGSLGIGLSHFTINRLYFMSTDPRIVLVPLTQQMVTNWNVTVISPVTDPTKYQTAVVVSSQQNYYGEVSFKIYPLDARYLKVDRLKSGGFLGTSQPTAGDLLLTKKGELLGIMVNNEYAVNVASIQLGKEIVIRDKLGKTDFTSVFQMLQVFLNNLPSEIR